MPHFEQPYFLCKFGDKEPGYKKSVLRNLLGITYKSDIAVLELRFRGWDFVHTDS